MSDNNWIETRMGKLFNKRLEPGLAGLPTLSVTMDRGLVHRSSSERKMETTLGADQHLLVRKGDIAYNTMRMWQGAFGVAKEDGNVSPAYVVLIPQKGIDSQFAAHFFKHHHAICQFKDYSHGLTEDRLRLYFKDFAAIPTKVPPVPEQQKIAIILSTWDRAFELTEKLIAVKQKRKAALMQQLLTGKKRFSNFQSQPWRIYSIGDLFTERKETGFVHLSLLSITATEGIVHRDTIDKKDSSNADKSAYLHICPGDIGYNTMRMWQGVSAVSGYEGIVSPAYTICIPKQNIDALFMSYLFKFPPMVHRFWRFSQGLVDDTLNLKFASFRKMKVTVPTKDEQQTIAAVLNAQDREIKLLQQKQDAIRRQKKGLMQQLLTGRVRVRVEPDDYRPVGGVRGRVL